MEEVGVIAHMGTMLITGHLPPATRGSEVDVLQPGGGRGAPATGALRTCPPRPLAVRDLGEWATDHALPAVSGSAVVGPQSGGGCQGPASLRSGASPPYTLAA